MRSSARPARVAHGSPCARSLANKARGALTTLGIIIGIVAVVTTMTAVNGLQNRFRESFSAVGTDVIYVSRMPWVVMNDFFRYRNRPALDLREARAARGAPARQGAGQSHAEHPRGRQVPRRDRSRA